MPELIEMLRLTESGRVPAASLTFTAVDFETTALHPGRVIEIAAVRVRGDGAVLGELSTLVDPGRASTRARHGCTTSPANNSTERQPSVT